MPAISSNDRAILTARAGSGRAGAMRAAFTPIDTQGATPGSQGGFYIWKTVAPPSTSWTSVKR